MTDALYGGWSRPEPKGLAPVPVAYRGVWARTLLQTPDLRDETSFVRWMQLGRWHADLRIPAAALASRRAVPLAQCSAEQRELLGTQQGFCGVTQVTAGGSGEVCTWHRLVDYQPPGPHPDAGIMVFETPDCVVETGVHGIYREVWHRLPDSGGRLVALAEPARSDALAGARLFMAGHYLMRVWPQRPAGPHFEISFGRVASGSWHIEQSTLPELEGRRMEVNITRKGATCAQVGGGLGAGDWTILAWDED